MALRSSQANSNVRMVNNNAKIYICPVKKSLDPVIRQHFGKFGRVKSIVYYSKNYFGYAFLQYDNVESANAAIAAPKHEIDGKFVKAKAAHSQQQTPSVSGPTKAPKFNAHCQQQTPSGYYYSKPLKVNATWDTNYRKMIAVLNRFTVHDQQRRPLAGRQSEPAIPIGTTPINKLNEDCLREIFKYLNTVELLSTADVCNQFREVATDLIKPVKYLNLEMNSSISWPLLRLFGPKIESIKVAFGLFSYYGINLLLDRIATLGTNPNSKLTKIIISDWQIDGKYVNRLKPIFSRITSLSIEHAPKNGGTVADMLNHCAELKELELSYIHFGGISKIKFPKLETLIIDEAPQLRDNMVNRFLSLNPQLKTISMDWNTTLTSNAVRNLNPNIEKLELSGSIKLSPSLDEFNGLKNLKSLGLHCYSNSGENEVTSLAKKGLPIEELHLSGLHLNRSTVNGIKSLKHLKEIKFSCGDVNDNDQLVEMVKAHPQLKSFIAIAYFAEGVGIKRIKEMVEWAPELEYIEFDQEDCVVIDSKDFESILKLVQSRPNKTKLKIALSGYGCKSEVPKILQQNSREWLEFNAKDNDLTFSDEYDSDEEDSYEEDFDEDDSFEDDSDEDDLDEGDSEEDDSDEDDLDEGDSEEDDM